MQTGSSLEDPGGVRRSASLISRREEKRTLRAIDGKSFLIGGLLVVVAMCAMGGVPLMDGQYNGRFSLVAHDTAYGGVYVIDTVTGQVWVREAQGGRTLHALELEGYAHEGPAEPNNPQP
jgi:hypothetical protein